VVACTLTIHLADTLRTRAGVRPPDSTTRMARAMGRAGEHFGHPGAGFSQILLLAAGKAPRVTCL